MPQGVVECKPHPHLDNGQPVANKRLQECHDARDKEDGADHCVLDAVSEAYERGAGTVRSGGRPMLHKGSKSAH